MFVDVLQRPVDALEVEGTEPKGLVGLYRLIVDGWFRHDLMLLKWIDRDRVPVEYSTLHYFWAVNIP